MYAQSGCSRFSVQPRYCPSTLGLNQTHRRRCVMQHNARRCVSATRPSVRRVRLRGNVPKPSERSGQPYRRTHPHRSLLPKVGVRIVRPSFSRSVNSLHVTTHKVSVYGGGVFLSSCLAEDIIRLPRRLASQRQCSLDDQLPEAIFHRPFLEVPIAGAQTIRTLRRCFLWLYECHRSWCKNAGLASVGQGPSVFA